MDLLIAALALWILASGLDDLVIDAAWLLARSGRPRPPDPTPAGPPQRIAVLVPLWREADVTGRMVRHNCASIRYAPYTLYLGVYPNDPETRREADLAAAACPLVRVVVCPHGGPTSKADCLNWIYRRASADGFDVAVTHDAEDVIDPGAFSRIDAAARVYDMVQVPVLPLATPPSDWIHGVYCDEFAEYQVKELPARVRLGGFLPSCGVGVAFTRTILDRIAAAHGGHPFEPAALTEDYENGFRVWQLGARQLLLPIGDGVATREYFPRSFRAAVRQRARWLMGITLQSWEFDSTREMLPQLYWFWRDRKALIGNLASLLANGILLQAAAAAMTGGESWFAGAVIAHPWLEIAAAVTLPLYTIRIAGRTCAAASVYGWKLASLAPLRAPVSNLINAAAAVLAIVTYSARRLRGQPIPWAKTDHAYPAHAARS